MPGRPTPAAWRTSSSAIRICKQVVAHTIEFGLRGSVATGEGSRLSYNLGFYRSDLDNDIAFINSVTLNRAFFANVGETRRQGVDASLKYKTPRWSAYVAYTYTDATFQTGFVEAAGSNPAGDANGNITVRPGNRLPGIPAQQGKLGLTYKRHRRMDRRRRRRSRRAGRTCSATRPT